MAKIGGDNIGAQSIDGIQAKVGMTYLPTNKTMLILPLQGSDCPMVADEMVITGESTYSIEKMFNHFYERDDKGKLMQHDNNRPKSNIRVSVDLEDTDGDNITNVPSVVVDFSSIKDFEPDSIQTNTPLLKSMRDKQETLNKFIQLLQREDEDTGKVEKTMFGNMLDDASKRKAMTEFFQSVIAEIEAVDGEE
jgi:Type VI secretion system, VipA, VC_A0107 or Hcp2